MDAHTLWKTITEDLQVSLSPVQFNGWVRPLTIAKTTEVGGDRLILDVEAPSTFHQNMVEQRLYGQLKEAADRISDKQTEIRFTINTALSQKVEGKAPGPLFEHQQMDEAAFFVQKHGLREDFNFGNFAVSSSNEMAYAAAKAVADNIGSAYNPLFLYGGVGVGKTHLMQAIAIDLLNHNPRSNIIYCAGEEFTNEIIDAIQQKTTRDFKRRYRQVKGLFIDDIQFIAGKTTVQEEFFHTFNAVHKTGGQIVLTSDQPPSDIRQLEERLKTRFEAGLIVDIGKPDFELRAAIILIKAKQRKLDIGMADAQTIAANIESARKIEGFLTKLVTQATFKKQAITSELIAALLGKTAGNEGNRPPPLRPAEILRGVADYYNLKPKIITGTVRKKNFVLPRHLAMYLMRIDYQLPLTEIGSIFSGRDHTSIMHAVDKITRELKDSVSMRADLESIRNKLYH
jgi:chromosomal replication initiator protein